MMSGPGGIALVLALVAAIAYGIGYELGDAGTSAATFLLLAAGGAFLSVNLAFAGAAAPALPLAFGTGPALVAAACAYLGGRRRERCR
jgi:hypothetical protein